MHAGSSADGAEKSEVSIGQPSVAAARACLLVWGRRREGVDLVSA